MKHPNVFQQFSSGSFVVHKTKRPFSAIALDHAHEQKNTLIKGDGGAVGLTRKPCCSERWMVSGPEIVKDDKGVRECGSSKQTPWAS